MNEREKLAGSTAVSRSVNREKMSLSDLQVDLKRETGACSASLRFDKAQHT